MRSILDLNIDELGEILNTNTLPEGVGLQGIEERSDFKKLFAHRVNPKMIASTLLKERVKAPRGGDRIVNDTVENRTARLALKEQELSLRKERVETVTQMQTNIYKAVQELKDGQAFLVGCIADIKRMLKELNTGGE